MNILGLSCYYHDAAAALLQDGMLVAAAEEERFTRRKHDDSFPAKAIEFCLRRGGIRGRDLDYVVFYERPLQRFERILNTTVKHVPRSWRLFGEAVISWFDEKLWLKERIVRTLGIAPDRVLFTDHHVAHAASAFFCSPFREAALLTVDGAGEWTTAALGTASADWDGSGRNRLHLTHEIRFPHSLGLLYSAFTAFLGFEVNEGEYKVMGMAPYGDPRYLDRVEKLVRTAPDGSFELDLGYFTYQHSLVRPYGPRFEELFGAPRDPESEFFTERTHPGRSAQDADVKRNQYYADVAASIQRFTEEAILRILRELHRRTGLENLCLAGGVALNSVANGRILRETPFRHVFIPPAPGDSGGAIGAALYAWHVLFGKPRTFILEHAYWGEEYDEGAVGDFLRSVGAQAQPCSSDEQLAQAVTDELTAGRVVGWFQGRFEFGPRALGNRSILADPRRAEMKDIVNAKIKFREPFRPFAPVVPEERAAGMFQHGETAVGEYPARYMLMVLPWSNGAGASVPAVNHMGTGRLQTLRREWNPRYRRVLDDFGQATGTPVLMNTSFNLRGEPIVASPANAWWTFNNSGIDVLVLGNHIVRKGSRS